MSAGNDGTTMPQGPTPDDDDPFAYLYRPEGGSSDGQRQPARPPSYHQVRPVGSRTPGGQRPGPAGAGHGVPGPRTEPDAHYAAPETQAGGMASTGRRRAAPPPEPPRWNGLLVGAIAVVLAVVVGVGAAIIFSSDEKSTTAGGDPTPSASEETPDDDVENQDGESSPPEAAEPPAADLAELDLAGGARLESGVAGARSPDGRYIAGLGPGSTITWTFDFQGKPGQYYMYTTYSVVSDGQALEFSVNGTPRPDPVDLQDFNPSSDKWDESWVYTYNFVDLERGENTIEFRCADSCDVLIDQIFFSEDKAQVD